jgi:hypothetical protein
MKIRGGKLDELLHEAEDLFPWRWHPRRIRGFIESVNDNINRLLVQEREHVFQALYQFIFTGLLCAALVFEIKAIEYVTMTMRLIGKLSNERKEQVTTVLLVDVPKIKVKVSHGSQTIVAKGSDFLNDRRANPLVSNLSLMVFDSDKPEYALPGARYKRWALASVARERLGERTFSVEPQK